MTEPVTTCPVCGVTRNESIGAHLEAHHLNEFFEMEYDPESGVGVIIQRVD